jgi:hypothetical protein
MKLLFQLNSEEIITIPLALLLIKFKIIKYYFNKKKIKNQV